MAREDRPLPSSSHARDVIDSDVWRRLQKAMDAVNRLVQEVLEKTTDQALEPGETLVVGPKSRGRAREPGKMQFGEVRTGPFEWGDPAVRAIMFYDDESCAVVTRPARFEARVLTAAEEETLAAGGVDKEIFWRGPALRALVERETRGAYDTLLGDSLGVTEAATALGVNPSRVRQRLEARTLYGIKDGRSWRLPRFQFGGHRRVLKGTVPNIGEVLVRVPRDMSPLAVNQWFVTPNPDLHDRRDDEERPMTPLEWLNQGYSPETAAHLAAQL